MCSGCFQDLGIDFPLTSDAYEVESKISTGGSGKEPPAHCPTIERAHIDQGVRKKAKHLDVELDVEGCQFCREEVRVV